MTPHDLAPAPASGPLPPAPVPGSDLLAVFREHGDAEAAAGVLYLMGLACNCRGDATGARRCFEESLAAAGPSGDGDAMARARLALAELAAHVERDFEGAQNLLGPLLEAGRTGPLALRAQLEKAFVDLQRGLLIGAEHAVRTALRARADMPRSLQARAYQYLGLVLARQSDPQSLGAAIQALQQAADLVAGQSRIHSQILDSLGRIHSRLGNRGAAVRCFEQSLQTKRQCGDQVGLALTYGGMAEANLRAGDYPAAALAYQQDLELVLSAPAVNHALVSQQHCALSECRMRLDELEAAAGHLDVAAEAVTHLAGLQRRACEAYVKWHRGRLEALRQDPERALELYREAEESFAGATHLSAMPGVHRDQGVALLRLGMLQEAGRLLARAEQRESDPYERRFVYDALAELAHLEGRHEDAERYGTQAKFLKQRFAPAEAGREPGAPAARPRDAVTLQVLGQTGGHVRPGATVPLTIVAADAGGRPVEGLKVELGGPGLVDLGVSVEPAVALTDTAGRVAAVVRVGDREGKATVEVLAPGVATKAEVYLSVYADDAG
ncbi:MAG: tetratricopeptide repeat protein [Gemmatimonadota bacterium]